MQQFQLLEEKIDRLIGLITKLRNDKDSLAEKVQIQEERISDLTDQVEAFKNARDQAKQKIISLLDKIERAGC